METIKTYLINDNGEYKLKQHHTNNKLILKNSFEEKKNQRKIAQLAKNMKEVNVSKNFKAPNVVNTQILTVKREPSNRVKMEYENFERKTPNIGKRIESIERDISPNIHKIHDVEEKQRKFFNKICKIIGIHGQPHGKIIPFEKLDDPCVVKELFEMQSLMKEVFPSSKLTALHSNAMKKQTFPGVNMVRQIFKEMGYRMKPITYSEGYLGSKKLIRREYQIIKN